MSAPNQPNQALTLHRGIVKQVLSGDSVIIRGPPKGGPPPEKQICLSNINAPKLARRANPNVEGSVETKDEPFAWEAREFLRKKLIGKEVCFTVEYKVPGSGREYGCIYLGKDTSDENVTELIIKEGLVEVRRGGIKPTDSSQKLCALEDEAKAEGVGKWAAANTVNQHIRDIKWTVENPRNFVDSLHCKPVKGVIEHVRDGCTVRAFLNIDNVYYHATVMMSGVRCPMFKVGEDTSHNNAELFAEEAKFFTESRLLQRDVEIVLESVSNQNFLGSILHPNGSIAEFLLKEGFARCVDWSIAIVTGGPDKLRAAERIAKEKRLRVWKDFQPTESRVNLKDKEFQAKVIEIVNADAVVVMMPNNTQKKLFLASIRPPRLSAEAGNTEQGNKQGRNFRPLYDVPYMFEAREFLRKKLIGKKVNVSIDYIQASNNVNNLPERTCCTVTIGGQNVAEALVSKGLASVVRYRQDDDQRSAHYDDLLAAEMKAQKSEVNVKCLRTLKSQKAPLVKKRALMRSTFGDYRSKMKDDMKKYALSNSKMTIKDVDSTKDKKKPHFMKKCASLNNESLSAEPSSSNDFKFNFSSGDEHVTDSSNEQTDNSDDISVNYYKMARTGDMFRFNFDPT